LAETGTSSADLGDDLFRRLVPDKGLGVVVPVLGPELNGLDEVGHRCEDPKAESALGELIHPRRGGGGEVQVPAGPL